MTWQQFLTERVLKECWHEWRYIKGQIKYERWECVKCPAYCIGSAGEYKNRTFDNRNDLLDLYEAINRDGKWEDFSGGARWKHTMFSAEDFAEVSEWLFCLSGEGYEDRCKTVAEFYGWEESHD